MLAKQVSNHNVVQGSKSIGLMAIPRSLPLLDSISSMISWWALLELAVAAPGHTLGSSQHGTETCDAVLGAAISNARSLMQLESATRASQNIGAQKHQDGDSSYWPKQSQKVVFIKTHSTGSSTLTNILHRFCDMHNKTCAGPAPGQKVTTTVDRSQLAEYVDRNKGKIDIWPNHVIFEDDLFDALMPGAVKVSLFRDPQSRILSSYAHGQPWEAIVVADDLRTEGRETPHCGTAGELMSAQVPLSKFDKLDFVMLTEEYDLSLVMLGRRLGWELQDLLYYRLNDHHEVPPALRRGLDGMKKCMEEPRADTAKHFLERCAGLEEQEVYKMAKDRFNQQWQRLTSDQKEEVKRSVAKLKAGVKALQACCALVTEDAYCRHLSEINAEWNVRNQRSEAPPYVLDARCRQEAMDALREA